jgi:hypothetical protein
LALAGRLTGWDNRRVRQLAIGLSCTAVLLLAAAPAGATVRQQSWSFGGISASQRTVRIVVTGGGCDRFLLPVVNETATTVRITARIDDGDPGADLACPAIAFLRPQFAHLAAPLAGRRLRGTTPLRASPTQQTPPRVIGLNPADALHVLRSSGRKPEIVCHHPGPVLPRVTGQHGTRLTVSGSG